MKIAVIGIAQTKFGELWDKSLYDLLAQAQLQALADAGIEPEAIDQIFTGNMCAELLSGQAHLGAIAADILGINVPSVRIEGACASGGLALRAGITALVSGTAEVVLVNGVEKLTDASSNNVATALMGASVQEIEQSVGASFPGLFALITRIYMHQFGLTRSHLAQVSVKNHKNGVLNPLAHFRKEVSLEEVLQSPMIADPLSLLDCSPISDGAASILLSTPEFAQKRGLSPIFIIASAEALDSVSLSNRRSLVAFKATQDAAQKAYAMAALTPEEIDLVELHDAFTMAEIMSLEDLGFYEKGQAAHVLAAGSTRLMVNPSGGLKARGHPVGATGVAQAVEVVRQLRGQCGPRQVHNAQIGMTHNMGGAGTCAVVHLFSKE